MYHFPVSTPNCVPSFPLIFVSFAPCSHCLLYRHLFIEILPPYGYIDASSFILLLELSMSRCLPVNSHCFVMIGCSSDSYTFLPIYPLVFVRTSMPSSLPVFLHTFLRSSLLLFLHSLAPSPMLPFLRAFSLS